jgi:hypothetical protein
MKTIPLAFAALTLLVPLAAAPAVAQNGPAPVPALPPVDRTVLPILEPTLPPITIFDARNATPPPTLGMLVGMSLK